MEKARINFKKSSKDRLTVDYITTRLETLEALWVQFTSTHTRIIHESDATHLNASVYVTEDTYTSAEELFMDYKSELKTALRKVNVASTSKNSEPTTVDSKSELVRLPKISIPTFSGNYSEWTSFRDLFTSLIHKNKDLDDVQKLHYLKGYLVGEAEQLLRHIQITRDNYSKCWDKLEKRYNNKKFLSNCILKRFMSQKNVTTESASALKELLDTTNECLDGLQNLGIDTTTWDIIVIHIVCLKLDNETRKQWELKVSESSDDLPTLKQLQEFLETRFRALECFDGKSSKTSFIPTKSNAHFNSNPRVLHMTQVFCAYCSESHKLCNCKGFAKIDVDARRDFIQSGNFCFNCLGLGHNVYSCRQSTRCRICKRKHHSLLHPKMVTNSTDSQVKPTQSVERDNVAHATSVTSSSYGEPTNITTCFSTSRSQVLLATALVQAQSKTGSGITLRCLLDQGSEASFITESAVQLLGLKKIPHKSTITGLGGEGSSPVDSKSVVKVSIASLLDPDFKVNVHAFVLGKLTSVLPEKRIVMELWSELKQLDLADPTFYVPGNIDMLLGADIYAQILLEGIIKLSQGEPIAQRTSLGWILSGPIHLGDSELRNSVRVNHVQIYENEPLKKFWKLEADTIATDPKHNYTEKEKKCEDLFAATTKRDSTGRYIVKLPFRDSDSSFNYGNSEAVATRRFSALDITLTPHLAAHALQQVAYDEGDQFPAAADKVLKHFYVEDLLTGCESLEEGKEVYKEMRELMQKSGFELQKSSNNNEELLRHMNKGNVEVEGNLELKIDAVMKTLGFIWNRRNHELEYSVQLPPLKVPVTKRNVISNISLMFGPLGWLVPVIIVAKISIKKLWLSGIEWDDQVPPQLLKEGLNDRENLNQLTEFTLPRWNDARSDVIMELQGSCYAFAAIVYLRTVVKDGNTHVSLLTTSKIKVVDVMSIGKANIHAWTDSKIVLSWLNSRPNKWKTFFANSLYEIVSTLEPHQWSHVLSKDNPRDCTSRGAPHLEQETHWRHGLLWLKNKEISNKKRNRTEISLDEKKNKIHLAYTYDFTEDAEKLLISGFSTLRKLLRVFAFFKRFVNCTRKEDQDRYKWAHQTLEPAIGSVVSAGG